MPNYVKDGRVIYASKKAYDAIYAEAGYLPVKHEKPLQEEKIVAPEQEEREEQEHEGQMPVVELDSNDAMPLAARVAMLTYEELKAKAKELNIPKYNTIKMDALVGLVADALEEQENG